MVSVRDVRDFHYQDLHVHLIELVDLNHFDACRAYVEKCPGLAGTLSCGRVVLALRYCDRKG